MEVYVKLFTVLRELAGTSKVVVKLDKGEKNVKEVLRRLSGESQQDFKDYLFDSEGGVREHLQLLVNGKSLDLQEGLETVVKEGDVLAIVPPVGGG